MLAILISQTAISQKIGLKSMEMMCTSNAWIISNYIKSASMLHLERVFLCGEGNLQLML